MRELNLQVVSQAVRWLEQERPIWLMTVVNAAGPMTRPPGAMRVVDAQGNGVGAISEGWAEARLAHPHERAHEGDTARLVTLMPDVTSGEASPCSDRVTVLIERRDPTPDLMTQLAAMHAVLMGERALIREIHIDSGESLMVPDHADGGASVELRAHVVSVRLGPSVRLLIAGITPFTAPAARFAQALGYEVWVCDAREEVCETFALEGVEVISSAPAEVIAERCCHATTAVIAVSHDAAVDDAVLVAASRTPAFYIGVLGSRRAASERVARWRQAGDLSDAEIDRIHMPAGRITGSRTPAEVAMAVVAEIMSEANLLESRTG
ncbi:XdhC family protein [Salinicola avicenniae]|uniref:XdhC family protein n=1 Tax=Salinicola avicenniae TaxID=2916836 RepID=UPI00207359C8|nr:MULTISPECIES: XdhC/CoxI family protein [unclassified Salinicola]